MILPIGDDQVKGGVYPYVSYGLLFLTCIAYLYQMSISMGNHLSDGQSFIQSYGIRPSDIISGQNYTSLITSIFLHASVIHLVGNMLFLWIFADNIESNIGHLNFLAFYIIGGIAAALVHISIDPMSNTPVIGASGSIAAVLGAYLVIFPQSKIKLFAFLIFYVGRFRISAIWFLGIWIAQQLFSGLNSLRSGETISNIAWWAHIGGFVFGILFGLLVRKFGHILALDSNIKT